jgi:myo-inositol-1(or 4)-monophosphatase
VSTARELMPLANEAVDLAAEMIRYTRPQTVSEKADRDFASDLDDRIELRLRDLLAAKAPGVGFLGEEAGRIGPEDPYWVLDPIDGTANFLKGIPLCAVSLALVENGQVVLGVIDAPLLGTRYTATIGDGAFQGTRRLWVNDTAELRDAIVSIGDYATGPLAATHNPWQLAITQQLAEHVQRIRMIGTAALDLAWLAAGQLDASITLQNLPWDMAAGCIVAREAGAVIADHAGAPHLLESLTTVASTPGLLTGLLAVFPAPARFPVHSSPSDSGPH